MGGGSSLERGRAQVDGQVVISCRLHHGSTSLGTTGAPARPRLNPRKPGDIAGGNGTAPPCRSSDHNLNCDLHHPAPQHSKDRGPPPGPNDSVPAVATSSSGVSRQDLEGRVCRDG